MQEDADTEDQTGVLAIVDLNRLGQIDDDQLLAELRRRDLEQDKLLSKLHLTKPKKLRPALRRVALRWLSIFTACLLAVIFVFSAYNKEVPDFFKTLVGTYVGAVAGILTGSQET